MRNENPAIVNDVLNGTLHYTSYVDIYLDNGEYISVSDDNLWGNGVTIEGSVCPNDEINVGSVVIPRMTLRIIDNDYFIRGLVDDFVGKKVKYYIECDDHDNERIDLFEGIIIEYPKDTSQVFTLECHGVLAKFDVPYETNLTFPATLKQIADECCEIATDGDTRITGEFPGGEYYVMEKPAMGNVSCRQVLSWIAQMTGTFVRTVGKDIRFDWFKVDNKPQYEYLTKSEPNFYRGSVTISGVRVTSYTTGINDLGDIDEPDTFIFGMSEEEYQEYYKGIKKPVVINIEGNPLVEKGRARSVAFLAHDIVGFTFTPFTASLFSNPLLDVGDYFFSGGKESWVGSYSLTMGSSMSIGIDRDSEWMTGRKSLSSQKQLAYEMAANVAKVSVNAKASTEVITKLLTGLFNLEKKKVSGRDVFYDEEMGTMFYISNGNIYQSSDGSNWEIDQNGANIFSLLNRKLLIQSRIDFGNMTNILKGSDRFDFGDKGPWNHAYPDLSRVLYENGEYILSYTGYAGRYVGVSSNNKENNYAIPYSLVRGKRISLTLEARSDDYVPERNTGLNVTFALCDGRHTDRGKYRTPAGNRSTTNFPQNLNSEWQEFGCVVDVTDDFFTNTTSAWRGDIDDTTRFYVQIYNYSPYNLQVRRVRMVIGDIQPVPLNPEYKIETANYYDYGDDIHGTSIDLGHGSVVAEEVKANRVRSYSEQIGITEELSLMPYIHNNYTVVFDRAFNKIPLVFCNVVYEGEESPSAISFTVRGRTEKEFTLSLMNMATSEISIKVEWFAKEM